MSKILRVKIQGHTDRNNMVNALANNRHRVWVEEKEVYVSGTDYYVCFEITEDEAEN